MTVNIIVDTRGFLRVSLHGVCNATDRIEVLKQVVHACNANGIWKIVVDYRDAEIRACTFDHYQFGKSFNSMGFSERPQISVITDQQKESSELLKFSCTVAWNRGTMIETFNTEREAMDALSIV
ncbi:MAG: hypothetical protein AB2604_01735 [Candidatus Thiodiazotropha taylori]